MINHMELTLKGPLCACQDHHVTLSLIPRVRDGEAWIRAACDKCGANLALNATVSIRYEGEKKTDGPIRRTLTGREAQLLDAIRSEQRGVLRHVFGDGWYWVDLQTRNSPQEARLMHHCGEDSRGVLWSLRDPNKVPHLTATVDEQTGTVVELLGRHNKPPKSMGAFREYLRWLEGPGNLTIELDSLKLSEEAAGVCAAVEEVPER